MEDPSKDPKYRAYVRRAVEAGLLDSEAGRTVSVEEVRARFGLSGLDTESEIAKVEIIVLRRNGFPAEMPDDSPRPPVVS